MRILSFLDDIVRQCSERVQQQGGSVIRLKKSPPATPEEIARVAERLGGKVPPELLRLGMFANEFEFVWSIDTPRLGGIISPSGRLSWMFSGLCPLDPHDYWWAEDIVSGAAEGVWHRKAILDCEANGDFLAYTIDPALPHRPVFCPVDGCEPIEFILGNSLSDFLQSWARIGFLSINEFCAWPMKTGLNTFDVGYFRDFENLLGMDLPSIFKADEPGGPPSLS